MAINQDALDMAFAILCFEAEKGLRCSKNAPFGPLSPGDIPALIAAGKIRTEVYGKNWRVVEILTGRAAGKRTMAYPGGGVPYMVNGKRVVRERAVKPAAATTPSGRPSEARPTPWKPGDPIPEGLKIT